jgi:hypothetical protein
MPPVGFKSTISAGKRPQTYVLDRASNGTGFHPILGVDIPANFTFYDFLNFHLSLAFCDSHLLKAI